MTVYLVTDLGQGDGGKGSVVHALACKTRAHTILKVGGANGCHTVQTGTGQRFEFQHWGCGTLEGRSTVLTSEFVLSPVHLFEEAHELITTMGLSHPFALLSADQDAVCATGYHSFASRLKELARGTHARGTVGMGIGQTIRQHERAPALTIRVSDLTRSDLRDRLAAVREEVIRDLFWVFESEFLPSDRADVRQEARWLLSDVVLDHMTEIFQEVGKQLRVVDGSSLRDVLKRDGSVVVERSHGVLSDRYAGFHPHTSALRTLPKVGLDLLAHAGYTGRVVQVGVVRACQVRHGAGPLPTADPTMLPVCVPNHASQANRYQGTFRAGPLDLVLTQYALACCGGPKQFDVLALTWGDLLERLPTWPLVRRYDPETCSSEFFHENGSIKVMTGEGEERLAYQAALTEQLFACRPMVDRVPVPTSATREQLGSFIHEKLYEPLGVPVGLLSFGPTEQDKLFRSTT